MNPEFDRLIKDLNNVELPRDLKGLDKLTAVLKTGTRLRWYYKDEAKFDKEEGFNSRKEARNGGIVVPRPGIEHNGGELEFTECVVVVDQMQCEKCYPEIAWVALSRLIDDEELVEIFSEP